jgi:hypothetical protein
VVDSTGLKVLGDDEWQAGKREALTAVTVINRVTALGMPVSVQAVT